ncbi:hypothetical protein EYF80_023892 [Liparis tanakae]|uniref:Uncharacterized protein n=1 Tax=Liparis tanakae TaxID=230148 RepID=A0A4Z2HM74_9TELE|nr:hypothetical protein EYF80_023892 [Liparis tanakae]
MPRVVISWQRAKPQAEKQHTEEKKSGLSVMRGEETEEGHKEERGETGARRRGGRRAGVKPSRLGKGEPALKGTRQPPGAVMALKMEILNLNMQKGIFVNLKVASARRGGEKREKKGGGKLQGEIEEEY